MKKGLGCFLLYILLGLASCHKENADCRNGYEGATCRNESREVFLGVFSGAEISCSVSRPDSYQITISPDSSDVTKVDIANIWNAQEHTVGELGDDRNIYINNQPISQRGRISGKAMIIDGKLKVSFSINGVSFLHGRTDNCIWMQQ